MSNAIQATLKRQAAAKKAWKTMRKTASAEEISERCSRAAKKAWSTLRRTYSKSQLAKMFKKAVATRRRNAVLQFAQ
jgi:hypothetical protein